MDFLERVKDHHKAREKEIKRRLSDFRKMWNKKDGELFQELCFCTLTPQASALECDKAIKRLVVSGLLFSGGAEEIRKQVFPIRFYQNKSEWIIHNRNFFTENGKLWIKSIMLNGVRNLADFGVQGKTKGFLLREWLVKNVKGFGYKEASHFLRNVGQGEDLAILDRHILKNLRKCGVIEKVPEAISKKLYFEIEKKMIEFSENVGIPLAELDLVFWSMETGIIFK